MLSRRSFLRRFGSLGRYSEQALEALHGQFNRDAERCTSATFLGSCRANVQLSALGRAPGADAHSNDPQRLSAAPRARVAKRTDDKRTRANRQAARMVVSTDACREKQEGDMATRAEGLAVTTRPANPTQSGGRRARPCRRVLLSGNTRPGRKPRRAHTHGVDRGKTPRATNTSCVTGSLLARVEGLEETLTPRPLIPSVPLRPSENPPSDTLKGTSENRPLRAHGASLSGGRSNLRTPP